MLRKLFESSTTPPPTLPLIRKEKKYFNEKSAKFTNLFERMTYSKSRVQFIFVDHRFNLPIVFIYSAFTPKLKREMCQWTHINTQWNASVEALSDEHYWFFSWPTTVYCWYCMRSLNKKKICCWPRIDFTMNILII
jgi:hypothetical protein